MVMIACEKGVAIMVNICRTKLACAIMAAMLCVANGAVGGASGGASGGMAVGAAGGASGGAAEASGEAHGGPSGWAEAEVSLARANGLIPAALDSQYQMSITRKEFCEVGVGFIEKRAGKTIDGVVAERGERSPGEPFSDVSDADITSMFSLGIVKGYEDGRFMPDGLITREEAATLLSRAARLFGMDNPNGEAVGFSDRGEFSDWALAGIDFISSCTDGNARVMGGTAPGTFSPMQQYTREQAFITFNRLLDAMSASDEVKLLAAMESACGRRMDKHVYVDMDHDGDEEIVGSYLDGNGQCQTWYCSSDGSICEFVFENFEIMDVFEYELVDLGFETHVAVNAYRMFGTMKNHTILALHGSRIECVVSGNYGTVHVDGSGEITLNVEAYDSIYDAAMDEFLGHTYKDTYLFYDGTTYKEYGATMISEIEFLRFSNAKQILDSIDNGLADDGLADNGLADSGIYKIERQYYMRPNGVLHVQCIAFSLSGDINYRYYTVRYKDNYIIGGKGEPTLGQMQPSFSDLDVIY